MSIFMLFMLSPKVRHIYFYFKPDQNKKPISGLIGSNAVGFSSNIIVNKWTKTKEVSIYRLRAPIPDPKGSNQTSCS